MTVRTKNLESTVSFISYGFRPSCNNETKRTDKSGNQRRRFQESCRFEDLETLKESVPPNNALLIDLFPSRHAPAPVSEGDHGPAGAWPLIGQLERDDDPIDGGVGRNYRLTSNHPCRGLHL